MEELVYQMIVKREEWDSNDVFVRKASRAFGVHDTALSTARMEATAP